MPPGAALALVAAGTVVALLVTVLPSPGEVFSANSTIGISAQVDRLAMTVATVLTWALAAWLSGVLLVVIGARITRGSRRAELIITRSARVLLPRAFRGVVVTALGVGSLSAMAGCAPATVAAAETAVATAGANQLATGPDSADATGSAAPLTMVLDWPMDAPEPDVSQPAAASPAATSVDDTPVASSAAESFPAESFPAESFPAESFPAESFPAVPAEAPSSPGAAGATHMTPAPTAPTVVTEGGPAEPAPPAEAAVGPAATPRPVPSTTSPVTPPTSTGADAHAVTVVPGDSLWSIAAAHLPADAGNAHIAAEWPRWYDANRALIGADPDRIEPGWQLSVPSDRQDAQ
ncbi:MAG: LysM peptidoglycan-binding domain-containing protein [Nakamurella sp.]